MKDRQRILNTFKAATGGRTITTPHLPDRADITRATGYQPSRIRKFRWQGPV